jgi:hypothetical protein
VRKLFVTAALSLLLGSIVHAQDLSFLAEASGGAVACQMGTASKSARPGGPVTSSFCSANCYGGGSVNTGTCSGSCFAQDFDCTNGIKGWVICSGVYTYCATPCPPPPTLPWCEDLSGKSCTNGANVECIIRSDNSQGFCNCSHGTWLCTT